MKVINMYALPTLLERKPLAIVFLCIDDERTTYTTVGKNKLFYWTVLREKLPVCDCCFRRCGSP